MKEYIVFKYFKNEFVKSVKDNPKYNLDPAKFLENNFRARFAYIRSLTGLDISNQTIKKIIYKYTPKEEQIDDAVLLEGDDTKAKEKEKEKKTETKEKKITDKDVIKAAKTLYGTLELYKAEDAYLSALVMECSAGVESLLAFLEGGE